MVTQSIEAGFTANEPTLDVAVLSVFSDHILYYRIPHEQNQQRPEGDAEINSSHKRSCRALPNIVIRVLWDI
jgi:hypothetical protein